MDNHRPGSTDEQLEHHSLPGTNMAGKGPGDECEVADEKREDDEQKAPESHRPEPIDTESH